MHGVRAVAGRGDGQYRHAHLESCVMLRLDGTGVAPISIYMLCRRAGARDHFRRDIPSRRWTVSLYMSDRLRRDRHGRCRTFAAAVLSPVGLRGGRLARRRELPELCAASCGPSAAPADGGQPGSSAPLPPRRLGALPYVRGPAAARCCARGCIWRGSKRSSTGATDVEQVDRPICYSAKTFLRRPQCISSGQSPVPHAHNRARQRPPHAETGCAGRHTGGGTPRRAWPHTRG